MDLNKPIDNERLCPNCGGKLKIKRLRDNGTFSLEYQGLEGLKINCIPASLVIWDAFLELEGQHKNRLLIDDTFLRIERKLNRAPVRFCEKCEHVWDMFDETDFVLSSNNKILINYYMSFIERCTLNKISPIIIYDNPFFDDIPTIKKECDWIINLNKAKLYQYKYIYDCYSEDNCDYGHLYKKALQNAEKCHTNNKRLLSNEYEIKADMCDDNGILQRFYYLNAALTSDISTHRKTKIQNNISEIYSAVLERWKEPIDVDKRRIIFIANNLDDIAGFYDPTNSISHYFTIDKIPSSIKFPYGRPKGNELYIAHRVNPDEYIPYENHEELLFMDKIRELRRLLRYLGATEITFTAIKGKSIEEFQREGQKVSADGGLLGHKASVSSDSDEQQKQRSSTEHKVDFIEILNPYKYPSKPEDLHWYDIDPEWENIVEARLHSDERQFIQEISTKQVTSLTEQSQLDVNAAYENLIGHINFHYHREREFHVEKSEETKWRITAKFKPLSEFENNDTPKSLLSTGTQKILSSDEQEYLEAVKQLVEDGEISELERHYLEAKRIKLGISEQRALELEASLTTQLIENEQNYLKMYRKYTEAGEITEKQRSILNDIAETYGLSEERVKQLEAKQ